MVFIYLKHQSVKVLNLEHSKSRHTHLTNSGWKHIVTLDASIWLETLLNLKNEKDVLAEVNDLKKIHF
jgi:hypothetical protein